VDGFSGPWRTEKHDFEDSSFMIAIRSLQQAQQDLQKQGKSRKIKLFFSERDPAAFAKLAAAVSPYNDPVRGFEIATYAGEFEEAISVIEKYIGRSFPLIFIDPTGWTGFDFKKIGCLFQRPKVEVLVNFMYAFVSRFVNDDRPEIIASLDGILGGPGWRNRLDQTMPSGPAVEKLFRETLKAAGNFRYVVSTRIDKATENRPHFFLVYGTKAEAGLKAFRETELKGLMVHERNRANAKQAKRAERSKMNDLFATAQSDGQEEALEGVVAEQKRLAREKLLRLLKARSSITFSEVVAALLEAHVIRETNVKEICVELANSKIIRNSWGPKRRRPSDDDVISMV
jgi:three-Cys-motif partner protein